MTIENSIRKLANHVRADDGNQVLKEGQWLVQKEGDWWTIRKKGRIFKCQTLEDARWLSLLLNIRKSTTD